MCKDGVGVRELGFGNGSDLAESISDPQAVFYEQTTARLGEPPSLLRRILFSCLNWLRIPIRLQGVNSKLPHRLGAVRTNLCTLHCCPNLEREFPASPT